MNKEMFWNIIRDVNSSVATDDQEAILVATRRRLMELSAADITRWHQIKEVYMDIAYRNDLWAACAATGTHYSDDGFTDFRSWLISQGKEVYIQVLTDPDSLAEVDIPREGARFEAYGYVATDAYAHKKEVEMIGLAGILNDYRVRARKKGQTGVEAYLGILEQKNDIYKEANSNPLKAEEKEDILAELILGPDITSCWNRAMLPKIVPRLCTKYNIIHGAGMA